MAAKHPWLMRRGDTFYLRAKVPADLVKVAEKSEIKRSLRTTDRATAERLIRIEAAEVEKEFTRLRLILQSTASPPAPALAREQLEELARAWFQDRLAVIADPAFLSADPEAKRAALEIAELEENALLSGGAQNLPFAQQQARKLLGRVGIEPDWKTRAPHDLAELVLRAELARVRLDTTAERRFFRRDQRSAFPGVASAYPAVCKPDRRARSGLGLPDASWVQVGGLAVRNSYVDEAPPSWPIHF